MRGIAALFALFSIGVATGCRPGSAEPAPRWGSLILQVANFPARGSGELRLDHPDGSVQTLVVAGEALLRLDSLPLGDYRLALDTVRVGDSGATRPAYDASRWLPTPSTLAVRLDEDSPGALVTVTVRKLTGGIEVTASGSEELWVELYHADGTGCRCTAWEGNGLRTSSAGGSVENLLPGDYRVRFLPITYFSTPAGGGGASYTLVPSPDEAMVSVRSGEMARASTVYRRQ